LIRLKNAYKYYRQGENIIKGLNNVSLEIAEHEFVSIMGPSGSGKSTVMNILGCLDRLSEGEYYLDGIDARRADERRLASLRSNYIGFVFQSFNLIPRLTARQNIELPLIYRGVDRSSRRKRADEMLERMRLVNRAEHLPNELSGGQRQRVAIARALIGEPRVILADEPTGSLDSITGKSIMSLFRELHENGATIVLITHAKEVADYAGRIMYLSDGRLS